MKNQHVFIALAAVALAAVVLYNRRDLLGNLAINPMAAGAGPAPFANNPAPNVATQDLMSDVAPWGIVPPIYSMIRRTAGLPATTAPKERSSSAASG